jgi:hypothetical protein
VGDLGVESVLARGNAFVDHWDDSKLKNKIEESGVHVLRGRGHLDGHKRVVVMPTDGGDSCS